MILKPTPAVLKAVYLVFLSIRTAQPMSVEFITTPFILMHQTPEIYFRIV